MMDFLTPYFRIAVACAYSLQQNIEGGNLASIWQQAYLDLSLTVTTVLGFYLLFMAVVFALSLVASWAFSRLLFWAVLIAWLAPGVMSIAGFEPIPLVVPSIYLVGAGFPGESLATTWNYALALVFGWSLVGILTNLSGSTERLRHAYDHVWYALGIAAGLFFVATWHEGNFRSELAEEESQSRTILDILAAQVSATESQCVAGAVAQSKEGLSRPFCDWIRIVSGEIYRRRYQPVFVWHIDPDPTLPFFLTLGCDPNLSRASCSADRIAQLDRYNELMCAGPASVVVCRPAPETLNADERLSIKTADLYWQRYALALRPLVPMLARTWSKAAQRYEQVSSHRSGPHWRWFYFVAFAALAGGKISFASANLFKDSRRSLAGDSRRVISAVVKLVGWLMKLIRAVLRLLTLSAKFARQLVRSRPMGPSAASD